MISITNAPYTYAPAGNPIVFQVQSNNSAILYFAVSIVEAVSGNIIGNFNYHVRPDLPQGASLNLSDILSNLVQVGLNNSLNTLASNIDSATLAYRLIITEKVVVNGLVEDGATYNNTNDRYYTWDANFDRLLFHTYLPDDFVINVNQPIKFLNLKNQFSNTTGTSAEYLYFLNAGALAKKCRIRVYDPTGVQIHNYVANLPTGLMQRLIVSPKAINACYGTDFSVVGHYRVDLLGASDNVLSETKVYKYTGDACYLQPVNFIFSTSLGSYETFTFYNPKESISTNKTTLKSNVLQLNNGLYSDNVNGVLNQSDKIINTSSTSSYTAFSNFLSDDEFVYLRELVSSKNVYVELSDNITLVPVTIKNTSYNINLKYNTGKLNRLEITYEAQAGFIPSKSDLFGTGNGSSQIQFLDLPLPVQSNNGIIYVDSSNGSITI